MIRSILSNRRHRWYKVSWVRMRTMILPGGTIIWINGHLVRKVTASVPSLDSRRIWEMIPSRNNLGPLMPTPTFKEPVMNSLCGNHTMLKSVNERCRVRTTSKTIVKISLETPGSYNKTHSSTTKIHVDLQEAHHCVRSHQTWIASKNQDKSYRSQYLRSSVLWWTPMTTNRPPSVCTSSTENNANKESTLSTKKFNRNTSNSRTLWWPAMESET